MNLTDYLVNHASLILVPSGLLAVVAAVWALGSVRRQQEQQERPLQGYIIGGPTDPLTRHLYGPQIGGADDGAIDPPADASTVSRAAEVNDDHCIAFGEEGDPIVYGISRHLVEP